MNEDRVREIVHEVLAELEAKRTAEFDQWKARHDANLEEMTRPSPDDGPTTAAIKAAIRNG